MAAPSQGREEIPFWCAGYQAGGIKCVDQL